MSTQYYMRVEAVNLAHFVYDTHDISTIRGGSFILLEAIRDLNRSDDFKNRLTPISTAASQGLFFFEEDDKTSPDQLRIEVLEFLQKKTKGHTTFLAAIEPEIENNFSLVLEKLEAQIRRQQWRMPTISIPEFIETDQACYLDGWRPGRHVYGLDTNPRVENPKISPTTNFRRETGTRIKHKLFFELLDDKKYEDNLCVKDLGTLASDSSKGVLDGKIAFIHVDGNSFGTIRRDLCTLREERQQFDEVIQDGFRRPFLEALLQQADQDSEFKTTDEKGKEALRLEILLWGGDEMTLLVPAWKGWDVLDLFFERSVDLNFNGTSLSHRAVIIFCHHNSPILQIRRLADDLLDQTKNDIKARLQQAVTHDQNLMEFDEAAKNELLRRISNHHYGDSTHYLVLESFDMLQGSLTNFLSEYYKAASYDTLMIYAHEFSQIKQHLNTIRTNVSRGKVYEIIEAIQKNQTAQVDEILKQVYRLIPSKDRDGVQHAIASLIAENVTRWYIVADLWDYIPES